MRFYSYLAWPAVLISLVAWGGVFFAHTWIRDTAIAKSADVLTTDQKAAEAAQGSRIRAIAADTATQRERLESIVYSDVTDFADMIEAAGKSVGVSVSVKAALPVGSAKKVAEGASVNTLAFIIEAQGSFAGLVRFAKTLEHFPAFSSINQLDFERVPTTSGASSPWRAAVRLHVITTSDVAS